VRLLAEEFELFTNEEKEGLAAIVLILFLLWVGWFIGWAYEKSYPDGRPHSMESGEVYVKPTYLDCKRMLAITESPGNPEGSPTFIQLHPSCKEVCQAWEKENWLKRPVLLRLGGTRNNKTCEFQ
jgi:hypothetical protein